MLRVPLSWKEPQRPSWRTPSLQEWILPAEYKESGSPSSTDRILNSQIICSNTRPLAYHKDLLFSHEFSIKEQPYRKLWLQLWRGENSSAAVDAFASLMEPIDHYYASVLIHRWLARKNWALPGRDYYAIMEAADLQAWSPPLGSPFLNDTVVCGVNSKLQSVIICPHLCVRDPKEWLTCSEVRLADVRVLHFPMSILAADDPGQVLDHHQLSYGWSEQFRVALGSQLRESGVDDNFVGSKKNVRQRRISSLAPLFSEESLANVQDNFVEWNEWGYCSDMKPTENRHSTVLDTAVTCSLDDVDGILSGDKPRSPYVEGPMGLDEEEPPFSITIVFTTCRRKLMSFVTIASISARECDDM